MKDELVFSIDPGLVNVGVCLYNATQDTIVYANKVQLTPSMKEMKTEAEIIPRVYKLFFQGPLKEMIDKASIVLVEKQMKRKFYLVQYVIGAVCFHEAKEYRFVCPRSVKTHFKSGKLSRKISGTSVKGSKKNHTENKKTAVELATKLFPAFMQKVTAAKRDDVADAVLQAKWYADAQRAAKAKAAAAKAKADEKAAGTKKRALTSTKRKC